MEPIPEGQEKAPLTSFFFNTTGPVNRLTYAGTLTLHFNNDDVLDALQRAYSTEADIIAALPSTTAHYTITGVRLQARGPVFNDDLAFLGVECAYTVEYTIRR